MGDRIMQFKVSCICLILAAIIFACPVAAAGTIQTYIGDVVPLHGYSYTGSYVYLFLTGPNLPVNGVALDNIYLPADQGYATQVPVNGDGSWDYKWGTGSITGKLDAGVYTVWVADGPADLSHLQNVDYSTITVDLSNPYISAGGISTGSQPSQQPGSIDLVSDPSEASVTVNDRYRGVTPLTVDSLDPGMYNVTLSKDGYVNLSTPVPVESGSISEVNVTLVLNIGAIAINTTPQGASIQLDGIDSGTAPITLGNLTPGNHTIVASKDGYIPKTVQVTVIAGLPAITQIALDPVTSAPVQVPVKLPTKAAGLLPSTVASLVGICLIYGLKKNLG